MQQIQKLDDQIKFVTEIQEDTSWSEELHDVASQMRDLLEQKKREQLPERLDDARNEYLSYAAMSPSSRKISDYIECLEQTLEGLK